VKNPSSTAEELKEVLEMADYCLLDDLKHAAEASLVRHISPASYNWSTYSMLGSYRDLRADHLPVREAAQKYNAAGLLEKCGEWAKLNEEIMDRYRRGWR